MNQPSLIYELGEAGWATATFNDGEPVTFTVSYLHDSLRELGQSVLDLEANKGAQVLFMDEPGEMLLSLNLQDDLVAYELKWFDDWASWGIGAPGDFKLAAKGTMSLPHYKQEVLSVLTSIYETVGVEGYKELWIEHEFPIDVFVELGEAP